MLSSNARVISCVLLVAGCSRDRDVHRDPAAPVVAPELIARVGTTDEMQCATFVTELVKHPRWSLQVTDEWHAYHARVDERYVIRHDGRVAWTAHGMPERMLTLTPPELAQISGLGPLSCEPTEEEEHDPRYYGLAWGESVDSNRSLPMHSQLGSALRGVLRAAVDRYVARRTRELAPLTIAGDATSGMDKTFNKRTAVLHFVIAPGGTITVRRGDKQVASDWMEPREVIDLADEFVNPRVLDPEDDWIRGTMVANGTTMPFAYSWPRLLSYSHEKLSSILPRE
jgi:hypothetical protein